MPWKVVGTLIITDLKRSSLDRTEISEYTPPSMNALVTALHVLHFRFGRRSERLSRGLVILVTARAATQ